MFMHPTSLQSRCLRKLATVTALVASATAWAHDGHGMEGGLGTPPTSGVCWLWPLRWPCTTTTANKP